MTTTIFNVPGFQSLPKAIKQLLVATEAQLFDQPAARLPNQTDMSCEMSVGCPLDIFLTGWRQKLRSRQQESMALATALDLSDHTTPLAGLW